MAERNDHETNVVPLQRRKDPAEADRASLARTIFADEDDIGTFSRGNLVPPSSKRSPQDENQDGVDDHPHDSEDHRSAVSEVDAESTTAYFERIAEGAVEASESGTDKPEGVVMRGSAQLPLDAAPSKRGRRPPRRPPQSARFKPGGQRHSALRLVSTLQRALRQRAAKPVIATGLTIVLAIGGAVVAVTTTATHAGSTIARLKQGRSSHSRNVTEPAYRLGELGIDPEIAVRRAGAPRHSRHVRPRARGHRRATRAEHRARATTSTATGSTAMSASAPSTSTVSSQPAASSASTGQPSKPLTTSPPATSPTGSQPSPSPPAATSSSGGGGSSSPTSGSGTRPPFGENGTLGPGHGNGTS